MQQVTLLVNNLLIKKQILFFMASIEFGYFILGFVVDGYMKYGSNLQVEGEVISIVWRSNNHQLPIITILDDSGRKTEISHGTIILNKSNLDVGDRLVKNIGAEYCLINGEKVLFSQVHPSLRNVRSFFQPWK